MTNAADYDALPTAALLSELLHFAPDDLAANRAGRLSDAQRALLRARQRDIIRPPLLTLGIFAALLFASRLLPTTNDGGFALVLALGGVVLALFVPPAIRDWQDLRADLEAGEVLSVTGSAAANEDSVLLLEVGGQSFRVSREVLLALDADPVYAVYYTARSRVVLAIEALDGRV